MVDIANLIDEIKILNIKQEAIEKATGGNFNIFEITNMTHKEVHICQVIKELIDPKGSHCQGNIFLKLFVKHVLKLKHEFSDEIYSKTVVTAEHIIDENRRIDIYIKAGDKFAIPIEAKIWAGDQYEQCHDYYEYAKEAGTEKVILYYLTCDGHMPSEESTKGMTPSEIDSIQLITFRDEIIIWLEECLKLPSIIRMPSIREIMMQLIDALKRLTGQASDEVEMEIRKMINSKDMFKSADQLTNVISEMKEEIIDKFFNVIDKRISETYGLSRIQNKYDFDKVTAKSRNNRGICYSLGKLNGKKYDLGLRIALGTYPYAEFCLLEKGEIYWEDCSKIVKQNDIVSYKMDSDYSSIAWKFLIEDEDARPNLESHNDAYYGLIEEECFNSTVEEMLHDLDVFLKALNPEYKLV